MQGSYEVTFKCYFCLDLKLDINWILLELKPNWKFFFVCPVHTKKTSRRKQIRVQINMKLMYTVKTSLLHKAISFINDS